MFCAGLGLFITNQLMEHRTRGLRLFADYATYFEDSWMRGFQLVISLVFGLLVWGVLELGKALFDLIHLDWFGYMIEHNWFRSPVLAIAFAASVHLTDVRPALLRGMRNVGLILLSWLLPLVVGLGVGFLVALVFTGLAPLFGTRFAATILLWSVAITLVYLNAAYNDGDPAHWPVLPLRWAGRLAGPMMFALAMLAAYAIGLRVGQHGWTPQRVRAAAVALVALVYGGGYGWAALSRGPWLQRLERVNVVASLLILVVLLALFTPLADPARLSVGSQVGRLTAGKVAPGKFDYQFLRFDAGRIGIDALADLTHSANRDIAARARLALANGLRQYGDQSEPDPTLTEPALSHVSVYPKGATLPGDFVAANIGDPGFGRSCLHDGHPCDIIVLTGAVQGSPLLIVEQRHVQDPHSEWSAENLDRGAPRPVFGRGSDGKWGQVGFVGGVGCPGVLDALRKGQGKAVRPDHDDVMIGGFRLPYTPGNQPSDTCNVPRPVATPSAPSDASAPAQMGPAFGRPGGV